ncbi:protein EMSY-LIKE 3-like [Andrographis paniculata]|uniref:protein EMSY-LIKE 3-like n=1 Tax=Andrographis paniculata TaxID=175694 RepID=UPI0021E92FD2|nr:protein EMSY-LIKE 3-like [Andrographis paniculata]
MDYEPYDSSGTDDDFPPPHQNRISRGGRVAGNGRASGNGRPAAMGSVPYPVMYDEAEMENQIHQLEQEAYSSVLRAFKAQADALTWDKEGLITELRKELKLSNEEHRDILSRVNSDETIRRIREWRSSGGIQPGVHVANHALREAVPSPSVSASRKKQKVASTLPSQSFGGPPPPFHTQGMAGTNQQSSKRGSMTGSKVKKHKPGLPGSSSMKMQYSSGPAGRGQFGNRFGTGGVTNEAAGGGSFDPLIGRKVRTRWPDDNNFYEAVITDYNAAEGLHALVYDINTPNETWEWVNLSEISPEDIQWAGEDPVISRHGNYGGPGHGLNHSLGRDNIAPGPGRGRGLPKGHSRKDFPPSQNGLGKKGPDDIQLLHTETLIKEVERIFGASHPNPVEIEKAKNVLKEHELALTEAIARLADLSDGESDEGGRFIHGQAIDRE